MSAEGVDSGQERPAPEPPAFEVLVRRGEARVEPLIGAGAVFRSGLAFAAVSVALLAAPLVVDAVVTTLSRAWRQRHQAEAKALRDAARRGGPAEAVALGEWLEDDRPDEAAELFVRAAALGHAPGAARLARLYERADRPHLARAWAAREEALSAPRGR